MAHWFGRRRVAPVPARVTGEFTAVAACVPPVGYVYWAILVIASAEWIRPLTAVISAVHVDAPMISASRAAAVAASVGTVAAPEGVNHIDQSKMSGPRSVPRTLSRSVFAAATLYSL